MPINSRMEAAHQPITTEANLDLIDWTARLTRADKRGRVDATEPPILRKLGLSAQQWHRQSTGTETRYWRAIGTPRWLRE